MPAMPATSTTRNRIRCLGVCTALTLGAANASAQDIDHNLYAALLEAHTVETTDVAGTRVDYKALKKDSRWAKLVFQLARVRPERLPSRQHQLAFWINAYNILAINTVLENYPLDSIRDVGSFLNPVWDHTAGRIGAKPVTLGEIEHKTLRPMGEPRIHAAIVCASTSCPSLMRTPFQAAQLDSQLDAAVTRWLASDKKGVAIDRDAKRVTLSAIFDWFEEDFQASGGVLAFIGPYLDEDTRAWLDTHRKSVSIDHFDYDWSLNDRAGEANRASQG